MEKITYMGLPDCVRISNGIIDVVASTTVGPRILRYGFCGRENQLSEGPKVSAGRKKDVWTPWGGHRLWAAPEGPETYAPDNDPLDVTIFGPLRARFRQRRPDRAGFQKSIEVELTDRGSRVILRHTIHNRSRRTKFFAPWAVTQVPPGGTFLVPQEKYVWTDTCFHPIRTMTFWSYCDMEDPRLVIGRKFIRLRSDPFRKTPFKLGLSNRQQWAIYQRGTTRFLKMHPFDEKVVYPDGGSNCELFVMQNCAEIESLGSLKTIKPGKSVAHREIWELHRTNASRLLIGSLSCRVQRVLNVLARAVKT